MISDFCQMLFQFTLEIVTLCNGLYGFFFLFMMDHRINVASFQRLCSSVCVSFSSYFPHHLDFHLKIHCLLFLFGKHNYRAQLLVDKFPFRDNRNLLNFNDEGIYKKAERYTN